jgi:hypothetical protein
LSVSGAVAAPLLRADGDLLGRASGFTGDPAIIASVRELDL